MRHKIVIINTETQEHWVSPWATAKQYDKNLEWAIAVQKALSNDKLGYISFEQEQDGIGNGQVIIFNAEVLKKCIIKLVYERPQAPNPNPENLM